MAVAVNWATGYQTASPSTPGPNLYDGSVGDTSTYYPTSTNAAITSVWDLGTSQQVDNLKIEIGYSGSATYAFEASNNGTTWTNAFTSSVAMLAHSGFAWEFLNRTDITTTAYRYWRFSLQDAGGLVENPGGF